MQRLISCFFYIHASLIAESRMFLLFKVKMTSKLRESIQASILRNYYKKGNSSNFSSNVVLEVEAWIGWYSPRGRIERNKITVGHVEKFLVHAPRTYINEDFYFRKLTFDFVWNIVWKSTEMLQ